MKGNNFIDFFGNVEGNNFIDFFGMAFFIVVIVIYFEFAYLILMEIIRIRNKWIKRIISIILGFIIAIGLASLMRYLIVKIATYVLSLF